MRTITSWKSKQVESEETQMLVNGAEPATEQMVLAALDELGIAATTVHHPAVFTVAEAKAIRGDVSGAHIKNLFLRNKKGRMWLITCHEDRRIDLKQLGELVGGGRFSFASAERMMKYLGVTPGAVTPLAVINDATGVVDVVLDQAVLKDALINVHPLHNAATTSMSPDGLLQFLRAMDHEPRIIDLDPLCSEPV